MTIKELQNELARFPDDSAEIKFVIQERRGDGLHESDALFNSSCGCYDSNNSFTHAEIFIMKLVNKNG